MTTNIDWGTVLLDTVKQLAAQPGGEPWAAVAKGLVKLLEENTALKAQVERLRRELKTASDSELLALRNNEGLRKIIVDQQEALRRVVEIMRDAISREAFSYLDEAFAIAKGVMEE